MPADEPVRVAVCEDSAVYADGLKHYLEADGDIQVCAVYSTAEQMLRSLRQSKPDLLVVDLELPGLSGIAAIRRLMQSRPLPILVLSAHAQVGSRRAAEALACGALEARPKDAVRLGDRHTPSAVSFRRHIKRLARARVDARPAQAPPPDLPARVAGKPAAVIGVAASTGGPVALAAMLGELPADFDVPIMIVQHMSAGFVGELAAWLDGSVALPVRMATNGAPLRPGAWVAPDGAHLVLLPTLRMRLEADRGDPLHVPSGNALLASIARSVGGQGVGVVLTGMGRDGVEGLAALRAAGGLTIAQDEASSVVYGMPRAAAADGVDLELPPARIPHALRALRRAQPAAI